MTPGEMYTALSELQQKTATAQEAQRKAAVQQNLAAGRAFLEANASKARVTSLPSGLPYQVIEEGEGAFRKATDTVTVHYRGTVIDGTESPWFPTREIRINRGVERGRASQVTLWYHSGLAPGGQALGPPKPATRPARGFPGLRRSPG